MTERRKIARNIIISFLAGLFAASLFFAYVSYKAESVITVGVIFPSLFLLLILAFTASSSVLKRIFKKFYRPFMALFYGGALVFVVTFIIFCAAVMNFRGNERLREDTETVIVLGCHTFGMTPGKSLKSRLEVAYEVINAYEGGNELNIIVTGGQGEDESVAEGESMKAYLVGKGISEDNIFAETESHSTFENLKFSKKFTGWKGKKTGSAAIITSEYHMPRAVMLAKRLGYDVMFTEVYTIAAPSPADMFGSGIMREYFAFVKSYIFDREINDEQ